MCDSSRYGSFLAFLVLATVLGCSNEPFPMVEVSGRMTYEDGTPIQGGRIRLRFESLTPPLDEKTHPRPGVAYLNEDGTFEEVTTHKYADGIVRGDHRVVVEIEGESSGVPEVYKTTQTPLLINSDDAPFDFLVPRPTSDQ